MQEKLLNGKILSEEIKSKIAEKVCEMNIKPKLAIVLIGNNEASKVYVRNKQKAANQVGIDCEVFALNEDCAEQDVRDLIKKLNEDVEVNGIVLQLPLPKHLNVENLIDVISPEKDVDCFTSLNTADLYRTYKPKLFPATPSGIVYMLKKSLGKLEGKHVVVVGRSNIVGKPLFAMLMAENCSVTLLHSKSENIKEISKTADVLVVACGCPKLVDEEWVKEGAVVIDVGINRCDGVLCGDVDFERVKNIVSYISPVPGGVGPMTVCELMHNVYEAHILRKKAGK